MSDDDYEIGYGKPPKRNQFKRGQSGNPKGRPKSQKSIKEIFDEIFCKKKWKTSNGVEATGMEVAMFKLFERVNKGDMAAIRVVMSMAETHAPEEFSFIPPFLPSRGELAKDFAHELEEYEENEL